MIADEIWKDVKNYEGLYKISNCGRVKSIKFRNRMTQYDRETIIKPYVNKRNGYQYVSLCKNNKKASFRIHKLVMEAFNPIIKKQNYDKEHTINHKNGIKTDNRLENLEWCSQSENQLHAYRLGLQKIELGKHTKKVIRLNDLKIYASITECAKDNNTRPSCITRVCVGNRSNYKGNKFAYLNDYENNKMPKFKGKYKKNGDKIWGKLIQN